ncbi:DsbA family protein [Shinella sp. CPCC 101442]|uniref:2-hydroxychromene-2-carboxylate isomerase n=1 Tax=Shinella sp. CPCC 101442 TaxID=2932265 RepID=UPI002152E873|nr:DsbA family protein [Shinella sp. CPCC 101442]MCR6502366.1 DsbA family protein [Shinella sp. CPCC 101442]
MAETIDYYFGIGSPWSFIGLEPFLDLSQRFNATIRPVVIPLIVDNGAIYSRDRPEPRRAYWSTDLRRWAAVRGKSLMLEGRASLSDPTPAGHVVSAAILDGQDWIRLTKALQGAFWEHAEDIGRPDVRLEIAQAVGLDGPALEERARSNDVREALARGHDEAKAAGVFGLPTFRYQGELYWGQDSLPFLERHLSDGRAIA